MAKRTKQQIAVDDALTKEVCKSDAVYDYMATCTRSLAELLAGNPNVFFYVKGSVALALYLRQWKIEDRLIDKYCARSDWDTQVVINPLLPPKTWFTTFKEVETRIVTGLRGFEDGLLTLFATNPLGSAPRLLAIPGVDDSAGRNAAGKDRRAELGTVFGRVFVNISNQEGFHIDGPNKWNLLWPNIETLVNQGRVGEILDLGIQAHNQAALTWSMVHPEQALANLNSVVDPDEQRKLLADTTRTAEETWTKLTEASDRYEDLLFQTVTRNNEAMARLRQRVTEQMPLWLHENSFVRRLPLNMLERTVDLMSGADQSYLHPAAIKVNQAKAEEVAAVQTFEADPTNANKEQQAEEAVERSLQVLAEFVQQFIAVLDRNQHARDSLRQWCEEAVLTDREVVAKVVDEHPDILAQLPEGQVMRLSGVERSIDRQFDAYREEPDPEEAAEAAKRMVERFAPFDLVEKQKGSLRIGSVLENATIHDFYLFRLLIRCQVNNSIEDIKLIPQVADYDTFKQQFKFRAELLDVSLPRNDSLETAEQWAHVGPQVSSDNPWEIPLPKGGYFLDEYILLFREVLDSKSSSAHKFSKRLWRACLVAEAAGRQLNAS